MFKFFLTSLLMCFSLASQAMGDADKVLMGCEKRLLEDMPNRAYVSFVRQYSFDHIISYNGYRLLARTDKKYDVILSVTAADLSLQKREYIFKGYELDISKGICSLKELGFSRIDE